jgi:hypothetical protein
MNDSVESVPENIKLWTEHRGYCRRQFRSGTLYGPSARNIEVQAYLKARSPDVFGPGAWMKLEHLEVRPMGVDDQVRADVYEPYSGTVVIGLVED